MAHTLASTSSSSSASAHSNYSYDVFLNHRGTDVKKTFASHLYRRLLPYRFRVFLDQPELQRGENIDPQIKRAIETASVHVAIFSPRYAESRWCLDELVLMLKSGATIIPVFYNVEPSDLRWTTDNGKYTDRLCAQALRLCCWPSSDRVYTEALLIHEKKGRYDQQRLADWRKALSDVSSLSGFELKAYNGLELYLSFSV